MFLQTRWYFSNGKFEPEVEIGIGSLPFLNLWILILQLLFFGLTTKNDAVFSKGGRGGRLEQI